MSVEKKMQQGDTLQEEKTVSNKTSVPLRSENKKEGGGGKVKQKGEKKVNPPSESKGDGKFVPTCSICGEKHWPFHPLVPCINIKKAKMKAKAERKALSLIHI